MEDFIPKIEELKRVLKMEDNLVLCEAIRNGAKEKLERLGRKDLVDFLNSFESLYGMNIREVLPEMEIDKKYGKELKELENEFLNNERR